MDKEILRKIAHMFTGLILIIVGKIIYDSYGAKTLSGFLLLILIFFLLADWLIADLKIPLPIYKQLERAEEKRGLHTVTHSILAAIVCIQFFDIKIALFSLLILTFGDAACSITDNLIGKKKQRTNTGMIAMLAVSFFIGILIINSFLVVLLMSATAALAEKYFKKVDDNLVIPIFSSFIGQATMYFF